MTRTLLLLAFLLASLAPAHSALPGVLEISGKQVPLPGDGWMLAGQANGTLATGGLGGYGVIRNLVLFRLAEDGALDAVAEINSNELPLQDGWGIAADCQRSELALTAVRSRSGWDAACFFIGHAVFAAAPDVPPAWRQARSLAAVRGLTLPAGGITAGFRVANRRDILDVRFHFLARDRAGFASDLAAWSAMQLGCIEAGLKQRLPTSLRLPLPGADEGALERGSMTQRRLDRLAALREVHLLTAEEFATQAALLRQAAATEQSAEDPAAQEFYRLLSLQGLSATSDALVTFMWTGQSVQATALTLLQAGVRTGRGYVTAYLWDWYGGTPRRPDTARVVDFTYGGSLQ